MSQDTQLTPMMAQYRRIKGELPPGALLLFRLGDFYEMFFEDAQVGAQLLNVALTKRGVIPMCGIPYHAAHGYISRLLKAGRKVAICDQVEDARPGQLVKREVTQILSPGAHFDERMLADERNNYLAAVLRSGRSYALALVDLTTGEFRAAEFTGDAAIVTELERVRPAEILHPSEDLELQKLLQTSFRMLNPYEDWAFAPETAQFTLRDHFKVASLDGFGLRNHPLAVGAAGAVVHYLGQQLRRDISHLNRLAFYQGTDFLILDSTTLRNLEVLEPLHPDAPASASLWRAMNRTVTPMGARRLRDWLSQPLRSVEAIVRRQEAIQALLGQPAALERFRQLLAGVRDLERTMGRLSAGTGNARDLLTLRQALERVPETRAGVLAFDSQAPAIAGQSGAHLQETIPLPTDDPGAKSQEPSKVRGGVPDAPTPPPTTTLLAELRQQLSELPEIVDLVARAIVDEPPLAVREGGMIRGGFDPSLDELHTASREGKDWIARLQQQEIERTGIPSLKIRFNSVFGYYIEITKSNLDKVPQDYIRKQTIANGERYITPSLKEMEGKILGAEERSVKLEYEVFLRVREQILGHLTSIQRTADALGQLDVLACMAETARLYKYTRPEVRDEGKLILREGRHPVLEQTMIEDRFVANDTDLDSAALQIGLITGPNMAGKSTYIRQVALLALLAHTGSFLPAANARVDLLDRIFTRIGASDDLARGQSTFMVEMSETANILNHATPRSLIILDEIGRGTSTFDGLSLAWSIVEFLHHQAGAKTLFATHYHELTELAGRLERVRNFNVAVREWNDRIIFLRKIVPGGTDKSYGIQVARLAGVPAAVVSRAKEILRNLEEAELSPDGSTRAGGRRKVEREKLKELPPPPQLDLFSGMKL